MAFYTGPMSNLLALSPWDWFAFLAVLAITFAAVLLGERLRDQRGEDESASVLELLLMGRQLTLPLFVPTLVVTWYGGIFGVTALSFERGIFNFVTQGAFWYGTYLILAFVLVDRVRRIPATGLADLTGQLFGPRARKLTAVLAYANLLPIGYISGLGIFIGVLLGVDWWWGALVGLLLVYTYALTGGLRAVVFSDMVQFTVMFISVWLIVFVCLRTFGGWGYLQAHLPATHWDPTGGNAWSELFIWGFIALGTLVDPNFHQRIQAANSTLTAKRGILLATLIWFCIDIATTLGGLYARAHLPRANSTQAYLQLGLEVLPPGLRGLFLAGLLATVLSTLDSSLFTAGATLAADLLNRPSRWWVKGCMFATGLLSWSLAPLFGGNIVAVWKILGGLASASLVPSVVYGLCYPKRLGEAGFLWSVGLGSGGYLLCALSAAYTANSFDPFYAGLTLSLGGLGVGLALSRRSA